MKMPIPDSLSRAELKDFAVLVRFAAVYCRCHHVDEKTPLVMTGSAFAPLPLAKHPLCGPCRELLRYALIRRLRCPLKPKPACKHCPVPCYRPGHREQVRQIMRFSGRYLLLRGRLDLLWHYFF